MDIRHQFHHGLLFILLLLNHVSCAIPGWVGAKGDEEKLIKALVDGNYDKRARPVINAADRVLVKFGVSPISVEMDEVNQILTTNVWLEQEWDDERLFWDPKDYNGLKKIRMPCDQLWLPDIVLYNNADDFTSGYMQSKAMVTYNGTVFWPPPAKLRSTCKIDITYFPFDDQECRMKFGSWTYDGYQVNVSKKHEIVDTSNYIESGEWNLLRVELIRNEVRYPCCDEPYPDVTFVIVMRRRILYYIFNIVCPCLWLTILSLLGFWLPPDSGEKITLGITVLLSFSVFMLLIAEQMPATSEFVPLIGIYLTVTMATTSLSIGLTVCVLHLYHVGPNQTKIPPVVKRFFFKYVARMLFIKTETMSDRMISRRVSRPGDTNSTFDQTNNNPETPLNSFLRQCQPLLRHYKFQPPDVGDFYNNGGINRCSQDPPSPLVRRSYQPAEDDTIEAVLMPPPPPPPQFCCVEMVHPAPQTDPLLDQMGESYHSQSSPQQHVTTPESSTGNRERKHHKNCLVHGKCSEHRKKSRSARYAEEFKHYEQISKHLRSLIKKQEEEEASQQAISDWRMLAYILDRFLFWFFLLVCFVSTFIILGILPAYKPDYSVSSPKKR